MGKQYGGLTTLQVLKKGANDFLSCEDASGCSGPRSWGLVEGCQFVVAMKEMERLIWTTWERKGVKS